jgi:hypothetical protein
VAVAVAEVAEAAGEGEGEDVRVVAEDESGEADVIDVPDTGSEADVSAGVVAGAEVPVSTGVVFVEVVCVCDCVSEVVPDGDAESVVFDAVSVVGEGEEGEPSSQNTMNVRRCTERGKRRWMAAPGHRAGTKRAWSPGEGREAWAATCGGGVVG